jgi:hypothetical protein
MLRRQKIAGFAALLSLVTVNAQVPQQSMKGYELYSWKIKGKWHYSLLVGTNRSKTYEEIMTGNEERIGSDALEAELKKIPRGEEVVWKGDAPVGAKRSAISKGLDLKHPVVGRPPRYTRNRFNGLPDGRQKLLKQLRSILRRRNTSIHRGVNDIPLFILAPMSTFNCTQFPPHPKLFLTSSFLLG